MYTPGEMKSIVACSNMLMALGFITQFKAVANGLKSLLTGFVYPPEDIKIVNYYRFEDAPNPDDNAILYAIETPNGEKGTLTDGYGHAADSEVAAIVTKVEAIQKKQVGKNPVNRWHNSNSEML